MFRWKKLGRVFNPQEIKGKSWIKEYAQAPSVLIFDKFIRVYFSCRPLPDENGQYVSYSAFIDLNRDNLFEIVNISKNLLFKLTNLWNKKFATKFLSIEKILCLYNPVMG